ncbi:MAG: hypothetical protein ACOY58_01630, partial [Candidatus Micrarchaeota archaeon]
AAQPLAMDERCERCGAPMDRVFILHGKALCRNCLYHEQDKWEIVPAKPGKSGTSVSIVIDRSKSGEWSIKPGTRDQGPETRNTEPGTQSPEPGDNVASLNEDPLGRKLLHSIGIDPDNPPKDRFQKSGPLSEKKMADDACVNCEAYQIGKMGKRYLGKPSDSKQK